MRLVAAYLKALRIQPQLTRTRRVEKAPIVMANENSILLRHGARLPRLAILTLIALGFAGQRVSAAESTNAPPVVSAPALKAVHMYNAPEGKAPAQISLRPVAMYQHVTLLDQPERQSIRASERTFRIGFSGADSSEVSIPHAVHQTRRRIFADPDDDDERRTPFGSGMDESLWLSNENQNWGWLERDINQSIRSTRAARDLNEEVIYRRNALMGSPSGQDTLRGRTTRRSSSRTSPLSEGRGRSPYSQYGASDPLSRDLLDSSR